MEFPEGLKYSKEHEWVLVEGNTATIGITEFAQEELGDVVYVELPEVGEKVVKDDPFGAVESVKAVSDVYAPVGGTVLEVNDVLPDNPETINDDPYGDGWMIRVEMTDEDDLKDLMTAEEYAEYVEQQKEDEDEEEETTTKRKKKRRNSFQECATLPTLPSTRSRCSESLESIPLTNYTVTFRKRLRNRAKIGLPEGLTELAVRRRLAALAAKNATPAEWSFFLGGGIYHHFIPSAVDAVISRSEFATSYTPYQPEVSQGTLQALFEYQTLICQLTGMEVSNAGVYDGASAAAEAVLMSRRIQPLNRRRVLMSRALHPHYRAVISTYLRNLNDMRLEEVAFDDQWCNRFGAADGKA